MTDLELSDQIVPIMEKALAASFEHPVIRGDWLRWCLVLPLMRVLKPAHVCQTPRCWCESDALKEMK